MSYSKYTRRAQGLDKIILSLPYGKVTVLKGLDLTGLVVGKLTVLHKSENKKNRRILWFARCECGSVREYLASNLARGLSKSCGCRGLYSLKGKVFEFLTVVEHDLSSSTKSLCLCRCVCGKTITATSYHLLNGHRTSCGCRRGYGNKVDISGEVFERLTALYFWNEEKTNSNRNKQFWLFMCECGKTLISDKHPVVQGNTQSCGCLGLEKSIEVINKVNASKIMLGEGNPSWKGGVSPLKQKIRSLPEYDSWRFSVYKRDGGRCIECARKGTCAHHLVFLSELLSTYNITTLEEAISCPALWDVSNGVTLCESCHLNKAHGGNYSMPRSEVSYVPVLYT